MSGPRDTFPWIGQQLQLLQENFAISHSFIQVLCRNATTAGLLDIQSWTLCQQERLLLIYTTSPRNEFLYNTLQNALSFFILAQTQPHSLIF